MNESDNQPNNSSTPGSNAQDLPRLYSLKCIGFATFIGSMLAGFYLISANYRALGLKTLSNLTLAGGVGVFSIYFIAVTSMVGDLAGGNTLGGQLGGQTNSINLTSALILNVAQVIALLILTQVLQGSMLTTFVEMQGKFHPLWRAIVLGLGAYFVLASISLLLLAGIGLVDMSAINAGA